MEDLIDFINAGIVWSPAYIIILCMILQGWLYTYSKLRDARKQIKILKLEKELLFQEQAELKSIIKSKHG
jgi:cytochrome c oxidase assembly factor CtaG